MKFSRYFAKYGKLDWILILAVISLLLFSLAELYSIALSKEPPDFSIFGKQLQFIAVGIFLLAFLINVNYKYFLSYSWIIYFATIVILFLTLFFAPEIRGTSSWLVIGGVTFQPAEFAKLSVIIFLASFFSQNFHNFNHLKQLLLSGAGVGGIVILILAQPDFGTSFLIIALWLMMLLFVGIKKRYIFIIAILLASIFLVSWFFLLQDYQKDRVMVFLNPELDPYGKGYNITQAIIATGSGQLFGRGLGFGSQSQLKFLPESQNDFIFAAMAEELGFVGGVIIIILFLIIFYRLIKISKNCKNNFSILLVLGFLFLIFIEMFINIGMNIGLFPVVGIPLPFISSGGSSLVVHLLIIGIVSNIALRSRVHEG